MDTWKQPVDWQQSRWVTALKVWGLIAFAGLVWFGLIAGICALLWRL